MFRVKYSLVSFISVLLSIHCIRAIHSSPVSTGDESGATQTNARLTKTSPLLKALRTDSQSWTDGQRVSGWKINITHIEESKQHRDHSRSSDFSASKKALPSIMFPTVSSVGLQNPTPLSNTDTTKVSPYELQNNRISKGAVHSTIRSVPSTAEAKSRRAKINDSSRHEESKQKDADFDAYKWVELWKKAVNDQFLEDVKRESQGNHLPNSTVSKDVSSKSTAPTLSANEEIKKDHPDWNANEWVDLWEKAIDDKSRDHRSTTERNDFHRITTTGPTLLPNEDMRRDHPEPDVDKWIELWENAVKDESQRDTTASEDTISPVTRTKVRSNTPALSLEDEIEIYENEWSAKAQEIADEIQGEGQNLEITNSDSIVQQGDISAPVDNILPVTNAKPQSNTPVLSLEDELEKFEKEWSVKAQEIAGEIQGQEHNFDVTNSDSVVQQTRKEIAGEIQGQEHNFDVTNSDSVVQQTRKASTVLPDAKYENERFRFTDEEVSPGQKSKVESEIPDLSIQNLKGFEGEFNAKAWVDLMKNAVEDQSQGVEGTTESKKEKEESKVMSEVKNEMDFRAKNKVNDKDVTSANPGVTDHLETMGSDTPSPKRNFLLKQTLTHERETLTDSDRTKVSTDDHFLGVSYTIVFVVFISTLCVVLVIVLAALIKCIFCKKLTKGGFNDKMKELTTLNADCHRFNLQILRPSKASIDAFTFGLPIRSVEETLKSVEVDNPLSKY